MVNAEPKALPTTFVHLADFNFSSVCLDLSFHLLLILNLFLTRLPCECSAARGSWSHVTVNETNKLLFSPEQMLWSELVVSLSLGLFVVCFCRFHSCLGSTIFTITAGTGTMTHITRCVLSDFPPECYKAAHVRVVSSKKRQKWYHSSIKSPTGPEHAVFIKHVWHLIDRRETVSEK